MRSVSIAAPTPPILTPHNQSYDQLLQQVHPYAAVRSTQVAPDVPESSQYGYGNRSAGVRGTPHVPGPMEASIFELMHHRGSEDRASRERMHSGSVPQSPPNKKINNYTVGESSSPLGLAGGVPRSSSAHGAFFGDTPYSASLGASAAVSSSARPALHVSPPRSPKSPQSLARVQPAPPRSPPTFLTAGRESDSDADYDEQSGLARQAPPNHMRGGGGANSNNLLRHSQEGSRRSLEVDILSKYEQTRRELNEAFQQPDRELSLGSSSPASQVEDFAERDPNGADYYYYEEGGEDDGSSFDGEGGEGDLIDEAEFVNDSASDGSY